MRSLTYDYNEGRNGVSNPLFAREAQTGLKMTAGNTQTIGIVVNGEARAVAQPDSLLGLLLGLGVDPEKVAVELNREIVRRPDWPSTPVSEGAQLEVVQFVGGG